MSVRTPDQVELCATLKLDKYVTRRDYKKKQELFYAILDSYLPTVMRLDKTWDGRTMAEMLACVLECDRTFVASIDRHATNSTLLATRDGWARATCAVAALIVERYSRDLPKREAGDQPLMASREELRERLKTSFTEIVARAQELEAVGETVRGAQLLDLPDDLRPQLQAGALERLFEQLAHEVLVIAEQQGGGVPESERDHEVAKRALVRLRLTDLRTLAEQQGINTEGSVEALADKLATNAEDDATEVARMVVGVTEETEDAAEHGLVTAVFPLVRTADLSAVRQRLAGLEQNYARIGVARWFICNSVGMTAGALVLRGRLRFYRVSPKLDYDQYDLSSTPNVADAVASVRGGRPWLEITGRLRSDAPPLALLLHRLGQLELKRPMTFALQAPQGDAQGWARRTLLLVGLLAHDLSSDGIEVTNLAIAQFETVGEDPASNRAPLVKNVRVGGQHLMSHRQVCELIVAGRALSRIQGSVRVALSPEQRLIVPFRIDIDAEHAVIATGFTATTTESDTAAIHRRLIDCVERAIGRSELPQAAVDQIPAIMRRAAEESPDEADIMPPPAD